jgi:DNA topoisomerase-1
VSAVQAVAKELGNTPAICRKCYIHPAILDAFQNHEHFDRWRQATASGRSTPGLTDEENALLRFLDAPSA